MTDALKNTPAARLAALGLTLPPAAAPVANYAPFMRTGSLLFVSGQLPMGVSGVDPAHRGKLGREVALEAGQAAARQAALNVLAQAAAAVTRRPRPPSARAAVRAIFSSGGLSEKKRRKGFLYACARAGEIGARVWCCSNKPFGVCLVL